MYLANPRALKGTVRVGQTSVILEVQLHRYRNGKNGDQHCGESGGTSVTLAYGRKGRVDKS